MIYLLTNSNRLYGHGPPRPDACHSPSSILMNYGQEGIMINIISALQITINITNEKNDIINGISA